jgi:predicted Rossmann-fold nucleotide-binding protein
MMDKYTTENRVNPLGALREREKMNHSEYENEASEVARQLPKGSRLGVIGSASFWGEDSKEICQAVGDRLAALEELVLITGGVTGVGEAVGRSFFNQREQLSFKPNTYHVLPRGYKVWDYGVTLFGGETMLDRREILGRLAPVYLAIEGGPGTVHEAEVAQAEGAVVVPICRTGGFSRDIYPKLVCPDLQVKDEWHLLSNSTTDVEKIGIAVGHIVEILLKS